jgi:adenylate cyclase class 2
MPIEVEQKFRVSSPATVAARLVALGGRLGDAQLQIDRYFNHPARDFARTDEALRIRQVIERNYLTYKGPKLDSTTKTRREIEVPISPGEAAAEQFGELLIALGFRPVAEVRKHRRKTTLEHRGRRIEVVLDDVDQVGAYVELEIVVDASEMDAAKQAIGSLAAELGLTENERKSYLELLLERV